MAFCVGRWLGRAFGFQMKCEGALPHRIWWRIQDVACARYMLYSEDRYIYIYRARTEPRELHTRHGRHCAKRRDGFYTRALCSRDVCSPRLCCAQSIERCEQWMYGGASIPRAMSMVVVVGGSSTVICTYIHISSLWSSSLALQGDGAKEPRALMTVCEEARDVCSASARRETVRWNVFSRRADFARVNVMDTRARNTHTRIDKLPHGIILYIMAETKYILCLHIMYSK